MNCFQLVRSVLDEEYTEIPGDDHAKDQAIIHALDLLNRQYKNLRISGPIDYSDPATRFAYIYRYTTSHANIVFQTIEASQDLSGLFDHDDLSISCLGGGPGSDFIGILKYCLESSKTLDLRVEILDKDRAWSESWKDVDKKLHAPFRISTFFDQLDVTDPDDWPRLRKYLNNDFFTLIYFMSEVFARKQVARPYFDNLFAKMRKGAYILYVDNNHEDFTSWFDALAAAHGVKILGKGEYPQQMPFSEEKTDLGSYLDRFGPPKLTANIAYRIGVKS
jgi:hypothetical protein